MDTDEIDEVLAPPFPFRHIALFSGDERVSNWVGIRPDGSSDGAIYLNRPATVTSWGLAASEDGPITHVPDPLGPARVTNDGDAIQTPPLTLS